MHMDSNEIEDKNNDSESGTDEEFIRCDMIIRCINLVWQCLWFSLPICPPFQICAPCIWVFVLKIYKYRVGVEF